MLFQEISSNTAYLLLQYDLPMHFKPSIFLFSQIQSDIFKKIGLASVLTITVTVVVYCGISRGLRTLYITGKSSAIGSSFSHQGFTVYTPGCMIPNLDPMDPSIRSYVKKRGPIKCKSNQQQLTFVDGEWLRINRTALEIHYGHNSTTCEIHAIRRKSENSVQYESVANFTKDIRVKTPFVRVTCFGLTSKKIYQYYHAFVLDIEKVETRCNASVEKISIGGQGSKHYNILAFGTDSISRLNMIRQMPKTRSYLLKELSAIELQGYNKIADNTMPNMVAFLSGYFSAEVLDEKSKKKPVSDGIPLVWKRFAAKGYRTMFAEDAPGMAMFNYLRPGFNQPPVDYYQRPFSLALNKDRSIWSNSYCAGTLTESDIVLEFTKRFAKKFDSRRYFALVFLSRITHDSMNEASGIDNMYETFLTGLYNEGLLNNTILLFFSDHGIRFGSFRVTYMGRMEERLPMFYVVLPPSFRETYPDAVANLNTNIHRLTTPFDVHETLIDVLNLTTNIRATYRPQRGLSLFSKIPVSRTCFNASILPQWCTCHAEKRLETNDSLITKAAMFVINEINTSLDKQYKEQCATLKLDKILDARQQVPDARLKATRSEKVTHQLTFRTKPGGAILEATTSCSLRPPGAHFLLLGEVSRLNEYGKSSACISDAGLRRYCHCTP